MNIRALADKYGLTVIEDACHALGAHYKSGQKQKTTLTREMMSGHELEAVHILI